MMTVWAAVMVMVLGSFQAFAAVTGAEIYPHGAGADAGSAYFLDEVGLIILLCLIVGSLGLAFYHLRMRQKAVETLSTQQQQILAALALMKSSDNAFLFWDENDNMAASPLLAEWLSLPKPVGRLSDLKGQDALSGFDHKSYEQLARAVRRLRGEGHSFSYLLQDHSRKKVFEAAGKTVWVAGSEAAHYIVWFTDLTLQKQVVDSREDRLSVMAAEKDHLQQVADEISLPIWLRDADLNLSWVNQAYVKAVEARNTESVLRHRQELVPTMLNNEGRERGQAALKNRQEYVEQHFVVIGGSRRAVRVHNLPLFSPNDDRPLGMVCYAEDVTDLEEAIAQLTRFDEANAETLDKLSTAVAIFGPDKTLNFYNSAFSRLWGLDEGVLSSQPLHTELLELMRENRRLPEQADFPAWKRQQLTFYTELLEPREEMWHLPDNTTLRVVIQPHPLGGLLFLFEDVTDRLALERSYNTLFAVQHETLNNLHEGVAVYAVDGTLELYNPAFADIWKLSPDFLAEQPHISDVLLQCQDLFSSPAERDEMWGQVLGDDTGRKLASGRLRRPDETVIDFSAVPLPDGATLMTYLDVTDSIRIETALRERNLALEATDRLKSEFLAHMSYELRNPLNSVIGFAELMQQEYQGPLNKDQHQYVSNILQASDHLLSLINDILDLTVIEAGGLTLEYSDFDLTDLVTDVANTVQENLTQKGIKLDRDIPENLKTVTADRRRLHQILYNLLSNAIKFTGEGGVVVIGARQEKDAMRLFVQDNGIGIPKAECEVVFDKFQTGSNTPKGLGAGLGLSLVKSFTELHGGQVELQSELGHGTKVICKLPRNPAQATVADGGFQQELTAGLS